jgi:ribosome-binding protein aMBF1 (putative translation factor)
VSDLIRKRLDQLDIASRDLDQRLETLRDATAEITTMRARGRSASEIVSGGPGVPARRELRETWSQVNTALHDYRVAIVVSMIEDEGMSVSDVARIMGNARQVISRLYHSAET